MTPGQKRHRELKAKAEAYDNLAATVESLVKEIASLRRELNPENLKGGEEVGVMGRCHGKYRIMNVHPNGMVQICYLGGHENSSESISWQWIPASACIKGRTWFDFERFRRHDGLLSLETDRMLDAPEHKRPTKPQTNKWEDFPL